MRLIIERAVTTPRPGIPPGPADKKATANCQGLQVKPEMHRGGSNRRLSTTLPKLAQQLWKHVWTEWETLSAQPLLSTGYAERHISRFIKNRGPISQILQCACETWMKGAEEQLSEVQRDQVEACGRKDTAEAIASVVQQFGFLLNY